MSMRLHILNGSTTPEIVPETPRKLLPPSMKRCVCLLELWDKPIFIAATRVAPLWFTANFLYNYSLSMTSVTSNTVLSATSGLFTFAISVYMGQDFFSYWKVAGVLASVAGATLTAVADTAQSQLPLSSSPSPSTSISPCHRHQAVVTAMYLWEISSVFVRQCFTHCTRLQ